MPVSSDRNLLFGILALQMDFITREQLVAGMQAWVLAKDVTVAEHLVRAGALRLEHRQLLEPLVEAHIRQHGDDPQASLASISSFDALRVELAGLGDAQIEISMANIPARSAMEADPFATVSVGAASSQGMRFRILRPHAEGGLGRVSVALDGELGREVAFKEIKPEWADDPDSRGRFTREAKITGGLEHPGIVPVYGLGAYPDGRPFYAMRFIRGNSLKEAIEKFHAEQGAGKGRKKGRDPFLPLTFFLFVGCAIAIFFLPILVIPATMLVVIYGIWLMLRTTHKRFAQTDENLEFRRLLQRLIDVCEAMDYAHSRGVLHRDLKPGNIMLGKHGETLVVDWGLAKLLECSAETPRNNSESTSTIGLSSVPEAPIDLLTSGLEPTVLGLALGTPAYMSPEQAQGRLDLLGPASDVFSLGAILCQILTGRPPYAASTKEGILRKAQTADYSLPRSGRRSSLAPLEAICRKALAPAAKNRYASCAAFATDVERFLADEPVGARRHSFSDHIARTARRHSIALLSLSAAIVVVTVGSLIAKRDVNQFREKAARTDEELKKSLEAHESQIQSRFRMDISDEYFQHGLAQWQAGRHGQGIVNMLWAKRLDPIGKLFGFQELTMQQTLANRILYFDRLAAPPLIHDENVLDVALNNDGTKVATASANGLVQIWDFHSGVPTGSPMRHEKAVYRVLFSPDGSKVVTTSEDKTARIWEAETGKSLGKPLRHDGAVRSAALSPDGSKVATASSDGTARIWSVATRKLVGTPLRHDGEVNHISFSPDGSTVATASNDNTSRLWNANTGEPIGEQLRHDGAVNWVLFSPDGKKLATASGDNSARIWDVQTGKPLTAPLRHSGSVVRVAFSPDGKKFATGNVNGTSQLWDSITSGVLCEVLPHRRAVSSLTFDSLGSQFATSSLDGTARIWNAKNGFSSGDPMRHDGDVLYGDFSPNGNRFATASRDGTAKLWDLYRGTPMVKSFRHDGEVNHLAFSADGTRIATASSDGTVRIWPVPQNPDLDNSSFFHWCAAMTGIWMDEKGQSRMLTQREWLGELQSLEGIENWQRHVRVNRQHQERLQWIEAEEAEFHKSWFAAAFHLRWALKKEPGNEELKKRLEAAEVKWKEEREAAKKAGPMEERVEK